MRHLVITEHPLTRFGKRIERWARLANRRSDRPMELIEPFTVGRHRRNDRDAEELAQSRRVDLDVPVACLIHQVEDEYHRDSKLNQL